MGKLPGAVRYRCNNLAEVGDVISLDNDAASINFKVTEIFKEFKVKGGSSLKNVVACLPVNNGNLPSLMPRTHHFYADTMVLLSRNPVGTAGG